LIFRWILANGAGFSKMGKKLHAKRMFDDFFVISIISYQFRFFC